MPTACQTLLKKQRETINQLDAQLVDLLNQRAQSALVIGALKKQMGQSGKQDKAREKQVIDHVCQLNNGPLPEEDLKEIFQKIISSCRQLQEKNQP